MINLRKSIEKTKLNLNIYDLLFSIFLLLIILAIILNPQKYINSCYNGLLTWVKNVIPALFPFFFLTKLLTELKVLDKFFNKFGFVNKKLFNAPSVSGYIFGMSIISGYPVGAKLIQDFYNNKLIDENDANKLITFCSNSGPLFIIGTVGSIIFNNVKIGYILYLSHIISAILNGLLYRNKYKSKSTNILEKNENPDYNNLLSNSINSAISSILVVGGFIAIFFIVIDILNDFNLLSPISAFFNLILSPLGIQNTGNAIANGLIEVTRGCLDISKVNLNLTSLAVITSGLITFGGFSIHAQSLTFLLSSKVNVKFYFLQKITQTIFACVTCYLLCLILL